MGVLYSVSCSAHCIRGKKVKGEVSVRGISVSVDGQVMEECIRCASHGGEHTYGINV